jgi:hypothetical protein
MDLALPMIVDMLALKLSGSHCVSEFKPKLSSSWTHFNLTCGSISKGAEIRVMTMNITTARRNIFEKATFQCTPKLGKTPPSLSYADMASKLQLLQEGTSLKRPPSSAHPQ